GARRARGGGAEATAVPADAGRATGDDHLRRHERLLGRRGAGTDQVLGAGVPRLHDGAAPRRRAGDPLAQAAPRGARGAAARGHRRVQEDRRALMPKPRELRRRIKSVQSTRKITKTMELVATSKLKRAQDRVVAARPYAASLAEVMADLYSPDLADKPTAAHAAELVGPLMQQFETGALDAVEVVFAQFKSAVSTPATTLRILPITPPRADGRSGARMVSYILKPSAEAILARLLPLYVQNQVYRALVETVAGFYGAQRTAMKN